MNALVRGALLPFLCLLLALAPAVPADAAGPWKLRMVTRSLTPTPPPSASFTVSGGVGGTDYAYAPVARDRTLWRTPLVAQNEDVIDLQQEVLVPYSPTMTSASVGGPHAGYFYSLGNGRIALKASTRGDIPAEAASFTVTITPTNASGTGASATLTVIKPADADVRFVSIGAGSDSNNGTTPALAWAHAPKNYNATGTALSTTFASGAGAGKVLFFKAETYRTRLSTTALAGLSAGQLPHNGVAGNPFVYSGTGWDPTAAGARATIDGSDVLPAGTPCANAADCGGNANWASIVKWDLSVNGGLAYYWTNLADGATLLMQAQYPTPSDLYKNDNPFVDVTGGFYRITNTTTGSGSGMGDSSPGTNPRIYQTNSPTTGEIHIYDVRICDRYGNALGNTNVDNLPPKVLVWAPGNESSYYTPSSYTYGAAGTCKVTVVTGTTTGPTNNSGFGAYGFYNGVQDIVQAGQMALSADGLTAYAWLPNGSTVSIPRRDMGVSSGTYSHITYNGFAFQRQSGNIAVLTSSGVGGAFYNAVNAATTRTSFVDIHVTQNRADNGRGVGFDTNGLGISDGMLERWKFTEPNPRGSPFRLAAPFDGLTGTPTLAQVRAYAYGKLRWNFCNTNCAGRTVFAIFKMQGAQISENFITGLNGLHGNAFSPYGVNNAVRDVAFDYNEVRDSTRPLTVSIQTSLTNCRNNSYTGNVFLGGFQDQVASLNSTEPCGVFRRNVFMWGPSQTSGLNAISIQGGNTVTFENNVIAGITGSGSYTAMSPNTMKYTIQNNLVTVNSLPTHNGTDQIQTSNTVATGAPFKIWDGTLTAEMITALGPGQLGVFRTVP